MKKFYQINSENFRCEPKARHRLEELKLEQRRGKESGILELWEVTEQTDIFNNKVIVKQLVTRYTPSLPNNGVFRILDAFDIRRAKKLYSMQKYDCENSCWKNFKMSDDLGSLIKFMMTYSEVIS